jgi:uncharacterized protein YndB with AHSA1/START domain
LEGVPMKELRASIDIQATPERVWDVLTDFDPVASSAASY